MADDVSGWNVVLSKTAHLIFLYLMVLIFSYTIAHRKERMVKQWIIISLVFILINMAVLLMVWPGMWSWDDVAILNNAQNYEFTPWQHFLTGLWHTICLQTLPFASGVLIIQILVAGLIVGYCLAAVSESLFAGSAGKRILCEVILFVPTISAPVMMYLLTGYRMGIYSFLELLLVAKMFLLFRQKQAISVKDMVAITLLMILVAAWRSEAIYYPITMLLCFLAMGKKKIRIYKAVIIVMVALLVTRGIGKWNDQMIGTSDYSISATVLPVGELIKAADREADAEEIQAIHKVLDCSVIYLNDGWSGEAYLWNAIQYGYTEEDLKGYYKAYAKLALKYPWTVIRETCQMFLETSGVFVTEEGYTTIRTACTNTDNSTLWVMRGTMLETWTSNGSRWNLAFNEELRDDTIRKIAFIDEDEKVVPGFRIVWNLMIPITLSFLCFLYCLFQKKWNYVTLYLCVFMRIPIVVLTACAPYFMYYLPVYLVGYVLSFLVILDSIFNRRVYGE
jgi:hypothetical protein